MKLLLFEATIVNGSRFEKVNAGIHPRGGGANSL